MVDDEGKGLAACDETCILKTCAIWVTMKQVGPMTHANPMLARVQNDSSHTLRRNLSLPDLAELSFFDEVLSSIQEGGVPHQPNIVNQQEAAAGVNPFMPGVTGYYSMLASLCRYASGQLRFCFHVSERLTNMLSLP